MGRMTKWKERRWRIQMTGKCKENGSQKDRKKEKGKKVVKNGSEERNNEKNGAKWRMKIG